MKTNLILTISALAFFSASCRTHVPTDPLTTKPSARMLPCNLSLVNIDPCAKPAKKKCCCCKKSVCTKKGAPSSSK